MSKHWCQESAVGSHNPDINGVCGWCGEHVTSAVPRPKWFPESELTRAYRESEFNQEGWPYEDECYCR